MKNLLLTMLAFGLISSSAFAQGQPPPEALEKKQFARVVASGTSTRIGFFHALHPDCSASGNVDIRVTKQPEHGKVDISATNSFPTYPKENIRYKCNQHRVRGQLITYKSAEKYVGTDELDLLVLYPNGFAWEVHVEISVR